MQPTKLAVWYKQNSHAIAGLDEAGRGPLAGPVVAAAVVLDPSHLFPGLADSKKLTPKKREALYDIIHETALAIGIATISHSRIDEINILRASLEAMNLAFEDAEIKSGLVLKGALVDGNQRVSFNKRVEQYTVVGGDNIFPVIMAASIIAKVYRDRLMLNMADLYPQYGFANHKGYGTAQHLKALQKLGPCPIHRRSFVPVNV
jgi:ribonuclease HII